MNEKIPRRYKRRTYFLKDYGQGGLLLRLYVFMFITVMLSGVVFFFIARGALDHEVFYASRSLQDVMKFLLPVLIVVLMVGVISTLIATLLFTHSIIGPLFRLKKSVQAIQEGDFSQKIILRKRDELKVVAEAMNAMSVELSAKVLDLKKRSERINQNVEQINKTARKSEFITKSEVHSSLQELSQASQELSSLLAKFRLSAEVAPPVSTSNPKNAS